MVQKNKPFIPPGPADKILSEFIQKITNIHPTFVEGIYVTGSLAMNDFYSNKSDIDFLVLCKELPNSKIVCQLKHIHKTIQNQFQKPDLSGCYLTSESIRTDHPENIKVLSFHQNSLRYTKLEMAPVSLWELKTNSITLYGNKAEFLPINISPMALHQFLYENINSYWRKWIKQHSTFLNRGILLFVFPRFTEWAVLGVARQLCTINTGRIVSKTEAGNYCLKIIPARFHSIIKNAIEIRKDNRTYKFVGSYNLKPSFKRLSKTIECVHFIIDNFNEIYLEKQLKNDWIN